MIQEVNCIGTVILRTDLYPDSLKNELKLDLLKYLDARISYFEAKRNSEKIELAIKSANLYGMTIWKRLPSRRHQKINFYHRCS